MMVARAWGIELEAPDNHSATGILVKAMLHRTLAAEIVEALPSEARIALETLLRHNGPMPWAVFTRKFGGVRVLGAAKRDRERPDLNPTSPAEVLWYRALIGKAFLNLPPEPQEYAYIPDDLLECLPALASDEETPPGRPASPAESAQTIFTSDSILDHATTLLSAIRTGIQSHDLDTSGWNVSIPLLIALLRAAHILQENNLPNPEQARKFLEAPRGEALNMLVRYWMHSTSFNELRLLPGLVLEGEWKNPALEGRQAILELLRQLPTEPWWSLTGFIQAVQERKPDFMRPAGDYDSWFIRKEKSDTYLRGFESWNEVDGAVIRFIITGPLFALGIYDLAAPSLDAEPTAFRPGVWAYDLLNHMSPQGLKEENSPLRVSADGIISLPVLCPRSVRYQVARFCEWEIGKNDEYRYRVTAHSLQRAARQGLRAGQFIMLLRRHHKGPLPSAIVQAVERFDSSGVQVLIQTGTILRVAVPEALEALRRSRAARYLGESFNSTTIQIKPGGESAVRNALAEAGYLAGSNDQELVK